METQAPPEGHSTRPNPLRSPAALNLGMVHAASEPQANASPTGHPVRSTVTLRDSAKSTSTPTTRMKSIVYINPWAGVRSARSRSTLPLAPSALALSALHSRQTQTHKPGVDAGTPAISPRSQTPTAPPPQQVDHSVPLHLRRAAAQYPPGPPSQTHFPRGSDASTFRTKFSKPALTPQTTPSTPGSLIRFRTEATATSSQTQSLHSPAPSNSLFARSQTPLSVPLTPPFPKHPKHWKPDGNLVVQLDGIRYKLYRGRIVQASAWFTDALANPDPDIVVQEMKGGTSTPVVNLDDVGVTMKGWDALLDAMDEAITYTQHPPSNEKILAILETARVLRAPVFEDWAKGALVRSGSCPPSSTSDPKSPGPPAVDLEGQDPIPARMRRKGVQGSGP